MNAPEFDEAIAHKYFAPRLNGECWNLLDKEERTEEEDRRMLMAAFASCYHWLHVRNNLNQQRGEWLIARAFAALGDGENCLKHALRCMEWTEKADDSYKDFDFAYAHEMLARGYALTGQTEKAAELRAKAKELGDQLADDEDRKYFLSDLAWGEWPGLADEDSI
ncbi:MAG: hypothetical protein HUJ26_19170 [Planctomycetaceae bacterium]|nr:hypothetical protein [Planctomycetaceae bacterium]